MKNSLPGLLGKYRDLLLAIAIFIVIDLGVLAFNYHASRLIEEDTGRINLAGEMRTYSQQLTKAILTLRQEMVEELPVQTSIAQISEAYGAHNHSLDLLRDELAGLQAGGLDDAGQIAEARRLLAELLKTWTPLAETVAPLLDDDSALRYMESVEFAVNKAVARNIRLMQQADDLTKHLESMAVRRAQQMRQIQLLAILLALVNFVFIVFKFLRNLARSDRIAAEAREETERILGTVKEGLFLLGADGAIGSQQSSSTPRLLGRQLAPGESLFEFLRQRMSASEWESSRQFVALLFNERVKPRLLEQLNPLKRIEFSRSDGDVRHLDFEFQQVFRAGKVDFLLVSVADITEQVTLERELAGAEAKAKNEVESLLAVLDRDPVVISRFLQEAQERLMHINAALQEVAPSPGAYQQLVNRIARIVHGVKGEAGALELVPVERAAHAFEEVLAPLRGTARETEISGDQLIPVAVAMSEMLEEIAKVARVVSRIEQLVFRRAEEAPSDREIGAVLRHIERLALRVAHDLDKKVRFEATVPAAIDLPRSLLGGLYEALPQLIRNAVAHGIESAEMRLRSGKPAEGRISCLLDVNAGGQLTIAVEDDGCGIDPGELRRRVVAKGLRTAAQVAAMSDEEVAGLIFSPGFSSLDAAGVHAGRGDGLAVVKEVADRLGARLQISSRPNSFTRFALVIGEERWQCA